MALCLAGLILWWPLLALQGRIADTFRLTDSLSDINFGDVFGPWSVLRALKLPGDFSMRTTVELHQLSLSDPDSIRYLVSGLLMVLLFLAGFVQLRKQDNDAGGLCLLGWFLIPVALAMIFGVIIGTYSSVFVASPIIFGWRKAVKRVEIKREKVIELAAQKQKRQEKKAATRKKKGGKKKSK